jgi:hypothetical protein
MRSLKLQSGSDLESTLQIPLFFHLASSPLIDLDDASTPSDIHDLLIQNLSKKWVQTSGGKGISFGAMFSRIAYRILSSGIEHFPVEEIESYVANFAENLDPSEVTNFLVAENFVHALPSRKLSFFHQSATEYFASIELKNRFLNRADSIRDCLSYRRWDHAVFLALSRFDAPEAIRFFSIILDVDITAALRAYHHAKIGREEMSELVLDAINSGEQPDSYGDQFTISHQLDEIQWTERHLEKLLTLSHRNSAIGGAAAAAAIGLSSSVRRKLLKRILNSKIDYNYLSEVGPALSRGFSRAELEDALDDISKCDNISHDALSCLSTACKELPAAEVFSLMDAWITQSSAQWLPKISLYRFSNRCGAHRKHDQRDALF